MTEPTTVECLGCGSHFQTVRARQRYCSTRCRRREKWKRRTSAPQWNSLRIEQNKRYHEKHREQGLERSRQWRTTHREVELTHKRQLYACRKLNPADLNVYGFLCDYIGRNRYAPTLNEISSGIRLGRNAISLSLHKLERAGKLQQHQHHWGRGITLNEPRPSADVSDNLTHSGPPPLQIPTPVTVDRAINWKRIARAFDGTLITRLNASMIARYFRNRCLEAGKETAERESNVLLALRFPGIFMERRTNLEALTQFLDLPSLPKRGCRSCGAKFTKIRPNQRYCSARCRSREKRHRREATPLGKLLKKQQNKRYRLRYLEKERERRREWIATKIELRQAQRLREGTRRILNATSARKRFHMLPSAIAAIQAVSSLRKVDTPL